MLSTRSARPFRRERFTCARWARLAAVTPLILGPVVAACSAASAPTPPRYDMELSATEWFGPRSRFVIAADSVGLRLNGVLPTASPCYDQISAWVEGRSPSLTITIAAQGRSTPCLQYPTAYQVSAVARAIPAGTYRVRLREATFEANPVIYTTLDSAVVTIP